MESTTTNWYSEQSQLRLQYPSHPYTPNPKLILRNVHMGGVAISLFL